MKGIKILNTGFLVTFSGSQALMSERKNKLGFKLMNQVIQEKMKFNFEKYGVHVLENDGNLFTSLQHLTSMGKEGEPPLIEIIEIEYKAKEMPNIEGFLSFLDRRAALENMSEEDKQKIKDIAKPLFEIINIIIPKTS